MRTKKTQSKIKIIPEIEAVPSVNRKPFIFISHDARDADLAKAFADFLEDASTGMLKSFCSSDRKGTAGIEFGHEWYKAIMSKLDKATDVVALLTHHSIDRPWILYEAGVAKGKLNTTVFGVAIGIPLERVITGPFGQFQNCGDDIDSLAKLVKQFIKLIPDASPREEKVREEVKIFCKKMKLLLKSRGKAPESIPKIGDGSIAKMFEEVKLLVRDLPDRMQEQLSGPGRRHRSMRIQERLRELEAFARDDEMRMESMPTLILLILLGIFRDDYPWVYELGLDLHRAFQGRDEKQIARAYLTFQATGDVLFDKPRLNYLLSSAIDPDDFVFFRHLWSIIHDILGPLIRGELVKKASGNKKPLMNAWYNPTMGSTTTTP